MVFVVENIRIGQCLHTTERQSWEQPDQKESVFNSCGMLHNVSG